MNLNLNNKTAVITGGTAGIGLAVAEALAAEQVNVILCARNKEAAKQQAATIQQRFKVKASGVECDVTQNDSITEACHQIEREFGDIHILINNAGAGSEETIMEASDERWYQYWDLHVMAAIRFARQLVPLIQKQDDTGVIINNASICAKQPLHHEPIYNVTKAALVMLSKCMAHELAKKNIRVNCINPGLIQTSAWEDYAKDKTSGTKQDWQEYLNTIAKEKTPIGRFASVEELANFFVFLCSPKASYCLGSTYYVDGGWLDVTT